MKIIKNIDLALSLNKGGEDLLFESLEEILEFYPVNGGMLEVLKNCKSDSSILGYVKSHSFNPSSNDYDFIQIYKKEVDLGDFETIHEDAREYRGFLVNVSSDADFVSKMKRFDMGNKEGFVSLNNF